MSNQELGFKPAAQGRFQREITPQSYRLLWQLRTQDERSWLESAFQDWLRNLSQHEATSQRFVYQNQEMNDLDLRSHRGSLCALISDGEFLAMQYLAFGSRAGNSDEAEATVNMIDQKLKILLNTLFAWHGSLNDQPDVPESFKQALREVEDGKVLDFDEPGDGV